MEILFKENSKDMKTMLPTLKAYDEFLAAP